MKEENENDFDLLIGNEITEEDAFQIIKKLQIIYLTNEKGESFKFEYPFGNDEFLKEKIKQGQLSSFQGF